MKYEKFTLYVDAATIVALRDILAVEKEKPISDPRVRAQLTTTWGELNARVQHFPAGIESSQEDWLL